MRWRRLRLRRADGQIFLDRWGIDLAIGGVFVHRMAAPDPGLDVHDHPFGFVSLVLAGGYYEERVDGRQAVEHAQPCPDGALIWNEHLKGLFVRDRNLRGYLDHRGRWSIRAMRLDEAHRIIALEGPTCWTIVVHGPRRRTWGFYTPRGWVDEHTYDLVDRAERRDLWNEIG